MLNGQFNHELLKNSLRGCSPEVKQGEKQKKNGCKILIMGIISRKSIWMFFLYFFETFLYIGNFLAFASFRKKQVLF